MKRTTGLRRCLIALALIVSWSMPTAYAVGFDSDGCRHQVAARLCERPSGADGTCTPPPPSVQADLLAIYDAYPLLLKRLMCGLEEITLTERIAAISGVSPSGYVASTTRIVIRKDLALGRIPLHHWASWKEQLPFSEALVRYRVDMAKAFVTAIHRTDLNGLLMYILTHELAHVLERLNPSITGYADHAFTCFRWRSPDVSTVTALLKPFGPICFYQACRPIALEAMATIYPLLYEQGFVSLYATVNPSEDFAEFFTFAVMARYAGLRYFLHLPTGTMHDVTTWLRSPPLRDPLSYIDGLIDRYDIVTQRQANDMDIDMILGALAEPPPATPSLADIVSATAERSAEPVTGSVTGPVTGKGCQPPAADHWHDAGRLHGNLE